jgi:hypothetical protein
LDFLRGLAASSLLAMGLTNHWYMVYRGLRRLNIPLAEYGEKVVVVLIAVLASMLCLLVAFHRLSAEWKGIFSLAGAGGLAATGFAVLLWCWVFSKSECESILRRIKLFSCVK